MKTLKFVFRYAFKLYSLLFQQNATKKRDLTDNDEPVRKRQRLDHSATL